jgi:hypothetical protein
MGGFRFFRSSAGRAPRPCAPRTPALQQRGSPAGARAALRLRAARIPFAIEPGIRFAGEVGEQATMFLYDPSGNALEFKAFRDDSRLFAR